MSRMPSMKPTCRLLQRSAMRTRRRCGRETRTLVSTRPIVAPARSPAEVAWAGVELGLMWTGSLGTGHQDDGGIAPALVEGRPSLRAAPHLAAGPSERTP